MFSHVTVGADDLDAARAFYDGVLGPLGLRPRTVTPDGGLPSLCWIHPQHPLPRFHVYKPFNGQPANAGNGSMVAFLAPNREAVEAAYAAGLAAGGADEGAPGPRDHYGIGYFGAYLRDPAGNKIHLAHRGDIPSFG